MNNIRVVSYNIRHGRGMDQKIDLPRIAKVILQLKPDLVAVQEVDRNCARSENRDIIAELGTMLKLEHAFAKFMDFQEGEYGMGILSRFHIEKIISHPLPLGGEPRCALEVEIKPPFFSLPLSFICIHNDFTPDETIRVEQINSLLKSLQEQQNPIILAGDFNAQQFDPSMIVLKNNGWHILDKGGEKTWPSDNPKEELDFIVLRNIETTAIKHRVIDETMASDHKPIYAAISIG